MKHYNLQYDRSRRFVFENTVAFRLTYLYLKVRVCETLSQKVRVEVSITKLKKKKNNNIVCRTILVVTHVKTWFSDVISQVNDALEN